MAKAEGPLMSIRAAGSVGKTITFSEWKGTTRVKRVFTPHNPQTDEQQENRGFLTEAVAAWQGLEPSDKQMWQGWLL